MQYAAVSEAAARASDVRIEPKHWAAALLGAIGSHAALGAAALLLGLAMNEAADHRAETPIEIDMTMGAVEPNARPGGGGGGNERQGPPTETPRPPPPNPLDVPDPTAAPAPIEEAAGEPQPLTGTGGGIGGGVGAGVGPGTGSGVGGGLAEEGLAAPMLDRRALAAYVNAARQAYFAELRFPDQAGGAGFSGVGALRVEVMKSGRVVAASLRTPTGDPALDRELARVARVVRRLPPLPRDYPRERMVLNLPVRFEVEEDESRMAAYERERAAARAEAERTLGGPADASSLPEVATLP